MISGVDSGAGGTTEVTLGCQTHGAGRAPWLPGRPGHTQGHSRPVATSPPAALCAPSRKQNALSWAQSQGRAELAVIIGRWACWLLGFDSPGAREKKYLDILPQPVLS